MKAKCDISKLPKWAQARFARLELDLRLHRERMAEITKAHDALCEAQSWFAIHGPCCGEYEKQHGVTKLFFCSSEGTRPACSLHVGDYLLLVRRNRDFNRKEVPL